MLGDVPGKGSGGVVVAVGGRAADVLGRKYFVRVWPVEQWDSSQINLTSTANRCILTCSYILLGHIPAACIYATILCYSASLN